MTSCPKVFSCVWFTDIPGAQFLGFQVRVRQVTAHRVVQFGEGGHAVGRVVGSVDAHGIGNPEIGVHAREQADSFPVAGIVHRREPRRSGKPPHDDMMLQEQVECRAGQPADIDPVGPGQRLPEVRTHDPFVPGLGAESRLPQAGIGPETQVGARDIGLMVIERILVGRAAEQFEAVFSVVPVQGGREMQASLPFRLDGNERFQNAGGRDLHAVQRLGPGLGAGRPRHGQPRQQAYDADKRAGFHSFSQ